MARTVAMVVDVEVACQVEVALMIKVEGQQDVKTSDQNAAWEVPASEQVESQKQVKREVEQHYHGKYSALHQVKLDSDETGDLNLWHPRNCLEDGKQAA